MCFLFLREFGLLPPQAARRLGDGHALTGSCSDQVGFEFRDHGHDVKEEPAYGIGRVVDRAADAQLDLAAGEFGDYVLCIVQGGRAWRSSLVTTRVSPARPGPACGQRFAESAACPVGASQALVRECLVRRHSQSEKGVLVGGLGP